MIFYPFNVSTSTDIAFFWSSCEHVEEEVKDKRQKSRISVVNQSLFEYICITLFAIKCHGDKFITYLNIQKVTYYI